ncbi:hypothetical protein RBH29_05820 [Herbivorax sp. ANBcel31]|uniref:hypothetical protein n=1 Tax=Herbivorax sp. ANBcel31 TaxID=3069754 RepID=UPI0027B853A2|nr:hypothetical protein [Herbivorax sp. ANBcel31]MDQ2085956.1 hypothetical protein [Herbivorax sp. ANBcel31]
MKKKLKLPEIIVIAVLTYLFVTWSMVIAIDLLNLGGLSDWLVSRLASKDIDIALVWIYMFTEGGPTEIFQWSFLSLSVLACGVISGLHIKNKQLSRCFLMLGFGMALMLMEDAGNIRHLMSKAVSILFYSEYTGSNSNPYAIATELIFYAFLGFLMLFPLIMHGKSLLKSVKCKKSVIFLLIGYCAYGLASFASATRNIGHWYQRLGEGIMNFFSVTERAAWYSVSLGFYLVDFWIEESVELIGASFIFVGLISYAISLKNDDSR